MGALRPPLLLLLLLLLLLFLLLLVLLLLLLHIVAAILKQPGQQHFLFLSLKHIQKKKTKSIPVFAVLNAEAKSVSSFLCREHIH